MIAIVGLGARIVVGALFVVAGVLKLGAGAAFVEEIANYQLASGLAGLMAIALPSVEVLVGVVLAVGPRAWCRAGMLAAALLLVAFTAAMASALARGIDLRCGCFGSESATVSGWTIARNVGLLALVGAAWFADARRARS